MTVVIRGTRALPTLTAAAQKRPSGLPENRRAFALGTRSRHQTCLLSCALWWARFFLVFQRFFGSGHQDTKENIQYIRK